jgi:hypothetical protein
MGKIHEYPLEATVLQDTDFADLDAFNSGTGLFQSKKISGLNLKDSVLTFITPNLDARDTANRDRANHTGTQDVSTITGLAVVATTNDYNDLDNLPIDITITVELIEELSVDFYAPNNLQINSTTIISGIGTVDLFVNDVAYILGNSILQGSKITTTGSANLVVNLNSEYE